MPIPEDLIQRMLGDPGDVEQLRRAVAAWVRDHPEDADAAREGMQGVEVVELLSTPPPE